MESDNKSNVKTLVFLNLGFIALTYLIFRTSLPKNFILFFYNFILIVSFQRLGMQKGIFFLAASIVFVTMVSVTTRFYYFINIPAYIAIYFIMRSEEKKKSYYERIINTRKEELDGNINLLEEEHRRHEREAAFLSKKEERYKELEDVMSILSSTLSLEEVIEYLLDSALKIIGKTNNIMIFLVDKEKQGLKLLASRMENGLDRIKDKNGDYLDDWVFKERQCLLVEDIKRDFRFSDNNTHAHQRHFRSVISCPLVTGKQILGLLRLENIKPGIYTTEDLRLLDILCDLGAVSLQNANLYKKTLDLAITDSLTGLYLRRYFLDRFKEELQRSLRNNLQFSLLILDIDNFKNYNDQYGHTAGDIVLKDISKKFNRFFEHAIISRFGGEEFAVLLPECRKSDAFNTAEALRKMIKKEPVELRRTKTHVSVSIGVSSFPEDAKVQDELILKADERLYMAKRQGKDRVICG